VEQYIVSIVNFALGARSREAFLLLNMLEDESVCLLPVGDGQGFRSLGLFKLTTKQQPSGTKDFSVNVHFIHLS
jgi:hypothetical protein